MFQDTEALHESYFKVIRLPSLLPIKEHIFALFIGLSIRLIDSDILDCRNKRW